MVEVLNGEVCKICCVIMGCKERVEGICDVNMSFNKGIVLVVNVYLVFFFDEVSVVWCGGLFLVN